MGVLHIKPKEATFQVVLDALALTPFYRAFLITVDVPAIYMQEFWATVSLHRFTKIIIDYFMSNDPSISRRNKMFWHTARDDTLFTSMRCISRHEDTQKAPKQKYIRKKADSDTSPKKKTVQATKGTRLKSKAKVAKPVKKKQPAKKTKAKGLAVLSEVMELTLSQSEDEDDNEDDGDNDDDGESDNHDDDSDDERTKTDSDEIPNPNLTNVDHIEYEEEDVDDRVRTHSNYELTDEEKLDDEERMDDEEVIKELYGDVNVNLGNNDTEMTDADQGDLEQQNVSQESGFEQEEEDAHVTLTPVLDTLKADEPVQSSSVSSDFTSKLLNLEIPSPADN
ncbi:hypothetical protein Tco_1476699 [Tanacetum coccineum]